MAHLSAMPARTQGWLTCQRRAVNLPPTVSSLPWGVPYAARIQFAPPVPETDADKQHHNSRAFSDIGSFSPRSRQHFEATYIPSWANRIETSGRNGIMSRSPVNVAPTTFYNRRMLSTSARRAVGAEHVKQPDVYDLAPQVPAYQSSINKTNEFSTRAVTYLVVGAAGAITFAGVRGAVRMAIGSMSPAADVLAMSKIEVDISKIPEGKNIILKWRGKPVFIRHRTEGEIKMANDIDVKSLRDPQKDSERVQKPEWLIMLGVCTHLGCVPIGEAGDYHGWFCPCHGSHYDISGRIRKGPACPAQLIRPFLTFYAACADIFSRTEVPEYSFIDDNTVTIG